MNIEQLQQGQALAEIIKNTTIGLKNLQSLRETVVADENDNTLTPYDGLYNFTISQYSDGSGGKAVLKRNNGNARLLNVIIEELERQLNEYQTMFDEL